MNLKDLLISNGYSIVKFANKVNLSISTISYYCSKKRIPPIATMQKLADALDVDLITIVNCFAVTEKDKSEE